MEKPVDAFRPGCIVRPTQGAMVTPLPHSGTRMTLASRIRRSSIALAALLSMAALAAPALAGNRAVPGPCDDAQPRSKPASSQENASTAARREQTSLNPTTDDAYVPLSRTAPPTVSPAPRPAEAAPAPASATPRIEKPKPASRRADAAASASAKPKKAAPAKVSIPNLPATPGMGTLLRVGITAGREIS